MSQDIIKLTHLSEFISSINDIRDAYEGGHSLKTSQLVEKLARAKHLPSDEIEILSRAALVHDAGKIFIEDPPLNKSTRLSYLDYQEIRQHPVLGEKLFCSMEWEDEKTESIVSDVILHHHENWDGSGYPGRQTGDAISIHARIMHVCDVYDALTSPRPYHIIMSKSVALEAMQKMTGSFDPELLELFVEIMQNEHE
jgi:HD-GYP domain-containing protein (c-di-GMP phosphodiesterase class II)